MIHFLRICFLFLILFFSSALVSAQTISDSTIKGFINFFGEKQGYKFEKEIDPSIPKDGSLPSGDVIGCYTGKDVLVVTIFSNKPVEMYGRMLVSKKYNGKIEYDEHKFQDPIKYSKSSENYYALLEVLFPEESNNYNCQATLQVYDRKNAMNAIKLLLFIK